LDVAQLGGESGGGWWFVCAACDHLWDQREPKTGRVQTQTPAGIAAPLLARRSSGVAIALDTQASVKTE
jgi:hypothetical protein